MKTAIVVFTSKLNGSFTGEVQGAPGNTCIHVTDGISEILSKLGTTVTHQEHTDEMYATVGKNPEAHNSIS